MKNKKHTAQSAFFNLRAPIAFLVCGAVAYSMLSGALLAFFHPEPPAKGSQRTLTFADRVAYQWAIEDVYWRHRIWPKERSDAKPSLDTVMSQTQLEKKVEDYLRKSQALEDYWKRPITGEQLQAEMDRMAKTTKQPELLSDLFAALDNDPFVIAECLARPALAERLVSNWYSSDQRIHGQLKRRAEADLLAHPIVAQIKQLSGNYSQTQLVESDGVYAERSRGPEHALMLNKSDWKATVQELATVFSKPGSGRMNIQCIGYSAMWPRSDGQQDQSASTQRAGYTVLEQKRNPPASGYESLPIGKLSPLQEADTHYYATAVIEKTSDRLKLGTVSWPKEPLQSWLAKTEKQVSKSMPAAVTGSYILPTIPAVVGCTVDTWAASSLNAPVGRFGHTAVWTGSELIVWGGNNGGVFFATGGRYNPSTDTWTATSTTNDPFPRNSHTAAWTGTEMIVWGGWANGVAFNSGGRYNPSTDSWTATSTSNAPSDRYGHTAVWTGSRMIVWGGLDANNVPQNTGGKYNPNTNTWVTISTTNAPSARAGHTAIWTGSEMVVWGGCADFACTQPLSTGGRYNPSADSWTATNTANAPSARSGHTTVWSGSEMIVWGGGDGVNVFDTGGKYDASTNSWTTTSTTNVPTGRSGHATVWTGTEMIVWGGWDGIELNTGGRYNPTTNAWTATNTAGAPSRRQPGATAVWTGTEMIVWGGYSADNLYSAARSTGGRYNPSTDTWVTTNGNAPDGRQSHSAVWTGTEMIVWGGYDGYDTLNYGPKNTGGRYSPSTDAWTATSTTNAPSARGGHTALWTGTEMILWGGDTDRTGGRYDPSTDTWTATSTTNAPPAPGAHTAVWTGNEMIVWGGGGLSNDQVNTGGRYNPATDAWVATSVTNAPTARQGHTAVWTGSEMIVWGGAAGSCDPFQGCGPRLTYFNTGGRYNPSTNTWIGTDTTPAPSVRWEHSALWTGGEMIVWGGSYYDVNSGVRLLNTGGRYNPTTNSWTATSTTNAPTARTAHSAVWTGIEMIIWGGPGDLGYFGTGGKYDPSTNMWAATSTTENAAVSRYADTAVWTGNEMIVWGGFSWLFGEMDNGGRYCAESGSPTPTPTASPTPTPTPTPCTERCSPTPRPSPTSAGRPTPPPRLTPPPTPTGSPRPTPAPRP